MTCASGSILPATMPTPHLAPPQPTPDAQPETVCQRTQWADEVEAYARDLQARLDAMMGAQ